MKITAVKPLVVHAEMRNWVFVKVETDQSAYGQKTETIRAQSNIGSLNEGQEMGAIAGVRDGLGEPGAVAAERIFGRAENRILRAKLPRGNCG
jgi:hypothetical protein